MEEWTDYLIAIVITVVFAAGFGFGFLLGRIKERNKDND